AVFMPRSRLMRWCRETDAVPAPAGTAPLRLLAFYSRRAAQFASKSNRTDREMQKTARHRGRFLGFARAPGARWRAGARGQGQRPGASDGVLGGRLLAAGEVLA